MNCFTPYLVLDSYNAPDDIVRDMQEMWTNKELGNDYYYILWDKDEEGTYPALAAYIRKHASRVSNILIHYWW